MRRVNKQLPIQTIKPCSIKRISCLFVLLVSGLLLLSACAPKQNITQESSATIIKPVIKTNTSTSVPLKDTSTPMPATKKPLNPSTTATSTFQPSKDPTATEVPCTSKVGKVETFQLDTKLQPLPLDFRVYTPPCYQDDKDALYPVLYLIHGQSYTDDQWDRLGADETADRLIRNGEVPPFIIVMPRDRYGGQPTENNFGEIVATELVPWVDAHYRTVPTRKFRAVGGLSRGAGWAVHIGIHYWKTFGALGGHSLALFHTDAMYLRRWLDEIPPTAYPRIYLDIGDRDRPAILESARWFEELLNEKNIPHEWHLFSGFHEEKYWRAHIEQYLRWYTRDWKKMSK